MKVDRMSWNYQKGYLDGSIHSLRDAYRYQTISSIRMALRVTTRTLYRCRGLHKTIARRRAQSE